MSKCPYKFAIHPGVIYGGPLSGRPGWADVKWYGHKELIKAYDLDPKDCLSWGEEYSRHLKTNSSFIRQYVHLHPVEEGQHAEALIKAILMYEATKAAAENTAKRLLAGRKAAGMDPVGVLIDECVTDSRLIFRRPILKY